MLASFEDKLVSVAVLEFNPTKTKLTIGKLKEEEAKIETTKDFTALVGLLKNYKGILDTQRTEMMKTIYIIGKCANQMSRLGYSWNDVKGMCFFSIYTHF